MASAEMLPARRPRVLFVAEAATMAHVTRPLALAESLDHHRYEAHMAVAENDLMRGKGFIFRDPRVRRWPIHSMPSARFLQATRSGGRLYDLATLDAYVRDDMRVIEQVRPDVVVGDLRLSLATSARLSRVPYIAITNAYWSPALPLDRMPVPGYGGASMLDGLVNRAARGALPWVMRWHARPLRQVRRRFGLRPAGDFRSCYMDADLVLYADHRGLVPLAELPARHCYLGPLTWSPPVQRPGWWNDLPQDRAVAYVTLGSSGSAQQLPAVLDELSAAGVCAMVAGSDAGDSSGKFCAPFLPGSEAACRAQLVVCNGGCGAVYQALGAGAPVLGIAGNMDQLLMMSHVESAGCGIMLRAGSLRRGEIARAAQTLVGDGPYRANARRMAGELAVTDVAAEFRAHLDRILAGPTPAAAATALRPPSEHAVRSL